MEATLKVTVELGETTAYLLNAILHGTAKTPPADTTATPVPNKAETPAKEDKPKADKPKAEKPKKEETADFDSLDDDAKLEAIKTEVTKHTKKGKSGDIKALLTGFDAGRASELDAERYGEFYAAIQRYGAGETVEAILGGGEDDLN